MFVEGLDLLAASALDGKICESERLAGSFIVCCYISSPSVINIALIVCGISRSVASYLT